jgi:hypothetical protein
MAGGKGVMGGRVFMRECSAESGKVKAGGLIGISFVGFRVFNVVYFDTNGKCESYGTSSKDFSYNGLNRKESGTWSIKDNKVIINLEDFSGEYEYTGGKLVSDQKTLSE